MDTRRTLLAELADGPVSGPDIAERLGISRAAVWKQVDALREAGFDVASTDDGYVVQAVPDYGGDAVAFDLDAPYRIEFHESIGSTNDRARELASADVADAEGGVAEGAAAEGGVAEGAAAEGVDTEGADTDAVVVIAEEQTGSRGRLDREWSAPAGGVYVSILIRPDVPPAHAPIYTLAAAVATTSVARKAGVDAGIKWPNDVLVTDPVTDADTDRGGAKLAGILTEMEGEADRVNWIIVGIGVNVNVDAANLPSGATSLRSETGGDVDRRAFAQHLLESFHQLCASPNDILPEWRRLATTLGRRVRVDTPSGVVEGEAVDVEFPGALVVETEDGREIVHVGDCQHLRPTN